jgi:glycosyltransferase involved in cell wall biosynthesis
MRVLYVSYDGILEPLGESQVFCYLRELAKVHRIHLISFEKPKDLQNFSRVKALQDKMGFVGISWHPLRYHKRPTLLATSFDVTLGVLIGIYLGLKSKIDIIHARGYVASLIATSVSRVISATFIFDTRGFWPEEKLEDGWSKGCILYRMTKWFERRIFRAADHVIVLTEAAVPIITGFEFLKGRVPPVTVIPTCTDLNHFRLARDPNEAAGLVIGYVGTATKWYLFDQTASCFSMIYRLRPDVRFLIVNRGEHEYIRSMLSAYHLPPSAVELVSATYQEMPKLMSRMHASIYFIKPVFSKKASSATKLGELLACGVPCMTNSGVGDVEMILDPMRVGIVLHSFDKSSSLEGVRQFLSLISDPNVSDRCRASAERWFSLEEGAKRYDEIYRLCGCRPY